jgi:hypothetical protein
MAPVERTTLYQDLDVRFVVGFLFTEDLAGGRVVLLAVFLAGAFLAVVFAPAFTVGFADPFPAVIFFAAVLALAGFLAAAIAFLVEVGFFEVVLRAEGLASAFALARVGFLVAVFAAFFTTRSLAVLSLANSLS